MGPPEGSPAAVNVRMAICGNVIERHDLASAMSVIESRMLSTTGSLAVGSVNLDHLHYFDTSRALGRVGRGGPEWLLLADGMPIAWRGQLLTAQPWPRVTGADLLPKLLELAETAGYRVGFLGGTGEGHLILDRCLARRYPRLVVAGMWSPSRAQLGTCSTAIAEAIGEAGVDILVVSLGKPRQEQWVDHYGVYTGAKLFLPFGAAADFLAGTKRRAPQWMQQSGLEWLYRLTREPRRLARRYLIQGPVSLVRAFRAHLIMAPGVYYVGTAGATESVVISDHD